MATQKWEYLAYLMGERRRLLAAAVLLLSVGCVWRSDWLVAQHEDADAAPPAPIMTTPLWQANIWVEQEKFSIAGRCHESVREIEARIDQQPVQVLANSCDSDARFQGEISLPLGDSQVTLVAKNPVGVTAGRTFLARRDDGLLSTPRFRPLARAVNVSAGSFAVDDNHRPWVVHTRGRFAFQRPQLYYGTADFLAPITQAEQPGTSIVGHALHFAPGNVPILFGSRQRPANPDQGTSSEDQIVVSRWWGDAWEELPIISAYPRACSCPMDGTLDENGDPVVVFRHPISSDSGAGEVVGTRVWRGQQWLQLADLPPGNIHVSQPGSSAAHLMWNDANQVIVYRLEASAWQAVGDAIALTNQTPAAFVINDVGNGWLLLANATSGDMETLQLVDGRWRSAGVPLPLLATSADLIDAPEGPWLVMQSESSLATYRWAGAGGWSPVVAPAVDTALGLVTWAEFATATQEQALYLGWHQDSALSVVRWQDGAWQPWLDTTAFRQGSSSFLALATVGPDGPRVIYGQQARVYMDSWTGTDWQQHDASVPGWSSPFEHDGLVSQSEDAGEPWVAVQHDDGIGVYAWQSQRWQAQGTVALDGKPQALIADGTAHLLLTTEDNFVYRVQVLDWDGLAWTVGADVPIIDADSPPYGFSFIRDSSGRLVVAFLENGARALYVYRNEGGTWVNLGGDLGNARNGTPVLQDIAGELWLLQQEGSPAGFDYRPRVLRWNGSTAWDVQGADPLWHGLHPMMLGSILINHASFTQVNGAPVVAVTELFPSLEDGELQVALYLWDTSAWVRRSTDLPVDPLGKFISDGTRAYWSTVTEFGGAQIFEIPAQDLALP